MTLRCPRCRTEFALALPEEALSVQCPFCMVTYRRRRKLDGARWFDSRPAAIGRADAEEAESVRLFKEAHS